jgi:hypothetical protein
MILGHLARVWGNRVEGAAECDWMQGMGLERMQRECKELLTAKFAKRTQRSQRKTTKPLTAEFAREAQGSQRIGRSPQFLML